MELGDVHDPGDVRTRRCGFCAVTSGRPPAGSDPDEPRHVAEARSRRLACATRWIISVDRDDLPDGGAGHFAAVSRRCTRQCRLRPLRGGAFGAQQLPRARARTAVVGRRLRALKRLCPRPENGRACSNSTLTVSELVPALITAFRDHCQSIWVCEGGKVRVQIYLREGS